MLAIRLGTRNMVRYLRRTLITTGTIAISFAMLVLTVGLSEGSYASVVDGAAKSGSGHVVLQSPGHDVLEPVPLPDTAAAIEAVTAAAPGAVAAPRSQVLVLARASSGAASLMALGVDPAVEAQVSMLPEVITDGAWLPDEPGRVGKAVIGRSLAQRLRIDVGDKLVLTASNADEAVLVRVGGLFATGSPAVDDGLMVLHQATAAQLLGSDAIHQVAVVLDDFHDAASVAGRIEVEGVDRLTWAEAMPELGDYVRFDRQGADVMFFTLFALVGLAILNSILMSVLERQRELGVLLALGTNPRTIFGMVLFEGLALSVLSVAVGLALGWAGVWYLGVEGVDLVALMGATADSGTIDVEGFAFDAIIYPQMDVTRTVNGVLMVVGLTVLAALYPAYKGVGL